VDPRGLDGFGEGHRRQNGGAPPGQHQLTRSTAGRIRQFLRKLSRRIENNWWILSTVLSLQAEAIDNAHLKSLVQGSPHRNPSIVLAHEWLQQGARVSQINLAYYPALLKGAGPHLRH
jgi:two-component sensor histidine kinase